MTNQPFFIPAIIIAAAAIPLVLGIIPRNAGYGIRTKKTVADDQTWYKANRFGGWMFVFSSVIYLIVAKFHPASGPKDPDFSLWLLHLAAFVLPLLAGLLLTLRYTKNL